MLVDVVATTAIWIRGKYGQTTATTVVTEAGIPIGRRGRGRELGVVTGNKQRVWKCF